MIQEPETRDFRILIVQCSRITGKPHFQFVCYLPMRKEDISHPRLTFNEKKARDPGAINVTLLLLLHVITTYSLCHLGVYRSFAPKITF